MRYVLRKRKGKKGGQENDILIILHFWGGEEAKTPIFSASEMRRKVLGGRGRKETRQKHRIAIYISMGNEFVPILHTSARYGEEQK